MNIEELRNYCLQKPGTVEEYPFGPDTMVFKAGGKLFLLAGLTEGDRFNAKCDPERAIELRERYEEVQPGYHMNKKHWNTVKMNGSLTGKQLRELIDHSYDLILNSLPAKTRKEIQESNL
jgi:predicted DNA-binding protein (MmcQ/YjbR family)